VIRNTASQSVQLFAYDYSTGAPKTGDAANLTAYVMKDSGALTALTDTSAAEVSATNAPGWYEFDVTQGETDAVDLLFTAKSSTANVVVVGFRTTTVPANFALFSVDSNGRVDVIKVAGTTQTARDIGAAIPAATAGASGGLLISGSNAGTTTLAALTVTGTLAVSDGVVVTRSTGNSSAISATGSGTGHGIAALGGVDGIGLRAEGGATNGTGALFLTTAASGHGLAVTNASGTAVHVTGPVDVADAANDIRGTDRGTILAGTVESTGTTTTNIVIKTISPTLTATDQLKGRVILFSTATTTAALRGQGAPIDGSTTTAITLAAGDALTTAPAEDDEFVIV
jgi:hypothetical protein